jgi:hypothetical protein
MMTKKITDGLFFQVFLTRSPILTPIDSTRDDKMALSLVYHRRSNYVNHGKIYLRGGVPQGEGLTQAERNRGGVDR